MNVQMSMHVNMCASVCVFIWILLQRQFARVPKIHTHTHTHRMEGQHVGL